MYYFKNLHECFLVCFTYLCMHACVWERESERDRETERDKIFTLIKTTAALSLSIFRVSFVWNIYLKHDGRHKAKSKNTSFVNIIWRVK